MAKSDQKKQAALEALLESRTLTEAAERAGISRRTLYSYIREDFDFSLAYRTIQEQSLIRTAESLQEKRERAAEVLLEILNDEEQPASIRINAARAIIDFSGKQSEKLMDLARVTVSKNTPLGFGLSF